MVWEEKLVVMHLLWGAMVEGEGGGVGSEVERVSSGGGKPERWRRW